MRTIKIMNIFLLPNEKVIKEKLMLDLSYDLQISDELRKLRVLPCKLRGMGIIRSILTIDNANDQYSNSLELINKLIKCNNATTRHINSI